MSNETKIFTVDKFLGLNESADGATELKLGEASVCENFYITDNHNLKSRPGVVAHTRIAPTQRIAGIWQGVISNKNCFVLVYCLSGGSGWVDVRIRDDSGAETSVQSAVAMEPDRPVRMFTQGDRLYISCAAGTFFGGLHAVYDDGTGISIHQNLDAYVPVTMTGCAPAGGGTALESMNILNPNIRLQYSADGESAAFVLPEAVTFVREVTVDGVPNQDGSYSGATHTYTFTTVPEKGVNNVEFTCMTNEADLYAAKEKFWDMKHAEAFNGSTDTRLFFYGDGTNICYYTGIPTYGSGLYIPAGNEIAVDTSSAAITGMVRHYSKLVVFQSDGVTAISYEPVTLADGSIIAGFYLRPVSRFAGNEMDNQIQTVNNCPRTLSGGTLYEWRYTAYQDERYAKQVSQKVSKALRAADPGKIITCDDNHAHTYYMFLNDDAGTVLVNRYDLDAWTVYTGDVFKDIRFAVAGNGDILFANATAVFRFDPDTSYDAPAVDGGSIVPVISNWESGFMAFGADYRRKYSSRLWLSLLPESSSELEITVETDKRDDYLVKTFGYSFLDFARLDFSNFSFLTNTSPKVKRIQIKVKKFIYYKLILRVTKPGARATVLGYDQQVRFSSNVK